MSAKHLNLGTVVDKNKIDSDKAFIFLFSATIINEAGATVTTLYFTRNSENIVFKGNTYIASNFTVDIQTEANQEPQVTLSAKDYTRSLQQYIDQYDGLVKSSVKLMVVHQDALPNGAPEFEEDFLITSTTCNEYTVTMILGTESAVAQRFPLHRQFRNRCAWKYKGERCKYAGSLTTCDFTRDGPNGCIAHGNETNFGGFPGLNDHF